MIPGPMRFKRAHMRAILRFLGSLWDRLGGRNIWSGKEQ